MWEEDRFCPYCGYDRQGEMQPSNALGRGTLLQGRYQVGNVIGQGGFGITYVGYDLTLEMKVAIKEYFPSGSAMRTGSISGNIQWDFGENDEKQWASGIDRFLKEAKRMARLDSVPSVVRVRDCFKENRTAYIVMDFVEGVTLKKYLLGHGVLRWDECLRLLNPILDSLAVIHDHGFIHRDISPDNIMLQPDGTARLLDMGAAMDVQANGGHASMVVVKRNFSAPEQYLESEVLGSWTDVYSMAATIYYCLTGKVVPEAMEREFKKTPLAFAPELGIPQTVAAAITAGLELKTEERIRDMRTFKARLTGTSAGADEWGSFSEQTDFSGQTRRDSGQAVEQTSVTSLGYEEPGQPFVQPQKPVKKIRLVLISILFLGAALFLSHAFFSHGFYDPFYDIFWPMIATGGVPGGYLLYTYHKQGRYKRGERCYYACLAFGILFGWMRFEWIRSGLLTCICFGGLLKSVFWWKDKREANQAVPFKRKAATVLCGVSAVFLMLLSIWWTVTFYYFYF